MLFRAVVKDVVYLAWNKIHCKNYQLLAENVYENGIE